MCKFGTVLDKMMLDLDLKSEQGLAREREEERRAFEVESMARVNILGS